MSEGAPRPNPADPIKPGEYAPFDDLIYVDDSGQAHRSNGEFASNYELHQVGANQKLIRDNIPEMDDKNAPPTPPPGGPPAPDLDGLKSDVNGIKGDVSSIKGDIKDLRDMTWQQQKQLQHQQQAKKEPFKPLEQKVNKNGVPLVEGYKRPFKDGIPIQYNPNADGTTRLGMEWNVENSEGAVMDWGDQQMDQEYIVTTGHRSGEGDQRYYIYGHRVYDLSAMEADGSRDFRDYPSSVPLHRTLHADDGSALPQRTVGEHIPKGKIGEEWLDTDGHPFFRGRDGGTRDPNDPVVIKKVEIRGALVEDAPSTVDRPNRNQDDPFAAIDAILPVDQRTLQNPHPEHRSDMDPRWRARRLGQGALYATPFLGRIARRREEGRARELPTMYPTLGTAEGRRVGHLYGAAEWERMDIRERREVALQRVHTMIDALAQVSDDKIETDIEVYQPDFAGRPTVGRLMGARRRGVDRASVQGQVNYNPKTNKSNRIGETKGWVLYFMGEGDQIQIKGTSPNRNRDPDLIIEKPSDKSKKHRSWMGGTEVAEPGVPAVPRYSRPKKIGVGAEMGSNRHYGDTAIENWTRPDKPEGDNTDLEVRRLIALGNALYALGQEAAGEGHENQIDAIIEAGLRPEQFAYAQ